MPAPPDKLPACPPDEPNRFAWIVRTAERLRREQAYQADLARSRLAAQRREALRKVADAEAELSPRAAGQYWKCGE